MLGQQTLSQQSSININDTELQPKRALKSCVDEWKIMVSLAHGYTLLAVQTVSINNFVY